MALDQPISMRLPPLVLLPGTLCDARVFTPMLRELHTIMPGLQATVSPTHLASSLDAAAADVLAAAPPQFALLGFSLGGIIALEVASIAAERLLGLALLGSTAMPVPPELHASRRAAMQHARQKGMASYVTEHLWPRYVCTETLADANLRQQIEDMAKTLGHAALERQAEIAFSRRDQRHLLPNLTMPALVLAGEEDDFSGPAAQTALAEGLPNHTLALIAGAGHFVPMEKPRIVAAHVAAWLHTVANGRAAR